MEPNEVVVHGRSFRRVITHEEIGERVHALALSIGKAYSGTDPLFLVVLRGAFMFAADLIRHLPFDPEVEFIRVSSYDGLKSTGDVRIGNIPASTVLRGREIVVIEDIVESGNTLFHLKQWLIEAGAAQVSIASMFFKPAKLETDLGVDYIGFEIPDDFIIGYGLDYNGKGRGLKSVYALSSGQ